MHAARVQDVLRPNEPAGQLSSIGKVVETPADLVSSPLGSDQRPIVAVWKGPTSYNTLQASYLRVAIWEDGRVVFAKDPGGWSHDLLLGQISTDDVVRVKRSLKESGVFELEDTSFGLSGFPSLCILVAIDEDERLLQIAESETYCYLGISDFMRVQPKVLRIVASCVPQKSKELGQQQFAPQRSWYLLEGERKGG
ncbi:MAG: hypothetical protein WC655_23510 [Candidatus Hydrogenedentales bacterium]|jgi:hypothetical protein